MGEVAPSKRRAHCKLTLRIQLTASQVNPFPLRRIFPVEGEGKCAVQHSVSVSQ